MHVCTAWNVLAIQLARGRGLTVGCLIFETVKDKARLKVQVYGVPLRQSGYPQRVPKVNGAEV